MASARQISKRLHWFTAALCFASVLFAIVFLQRFLGLPPCPICVLDRYLLVAIGVVNIGLVLTSHSWRSWLLSANGLLVILALLLSARHVYLELAPVSTSALSCFPSASANSLLYQLTAAFSEASSCALITWQLFGLTLAQQTFLLFIALFSIWLGQLALTARVLRAGEGNDALS